MDPAHRREASEAVIAGERPRSDRSRRIRDAVEASLSDIILLGNEAQVELAAGRAVHTAAWVISLRDFIRPVLDPEPVPRHLAIPAQGPARPSVTRGGKADGDDKESKRIDKNSLGGSGTGQGMGGTTAGDDDTEHHH